MHRALLVVALVHRICSAWPSPDEPSAPSNYECKIRLILPQRNTFQTTGSTCLLYTNCAISIQTIFESKALTGQLHDSGVGFPKFPGHIQLGALQNELMRAQCGSVSGHGRLFQR
jgi:hypothetical protein